MGGVMKKHIDVYSEVYNEYKETPSAKELMSLAFREILPQKGNWISFWIPFGLATIATVIIMVSQNMVELTGKIANILLNIQLALFGCIFAVYSLIIGFLSDKVLKIYSQNVDSENKSLLKRYTDYYGSALFLYFFNIAFTGIVIIICECIDPAFRLTKVFELDNLMVDNSLAFILLVVYLFFSFRIFYELKSTIYNTIVLFNSTIALTFVRFMDEEATEDEQKIASEIGESKKKKRTEKKKR